MDAKELHSRQQWTMHQKVDHTLGVIDQYINKLQGGVYLAFSGGKDSTVLMHLCEMIKPDIKCVFVNTGCEYPSVLQFVKKCKEQGHNIVYIRPKMTPRNVWAKYGFPLISKNVADMVSSVKRNPDCAKSQKHLGNSEQPSKYVIPKKWMYLIGERYDISKKCCDKLKKEPSRRFEKETGLKPIIGSMASESLMREYDYIHQGGCNSFEEGCVKSLPLSIWTDDDIWEFIRERNIEIADIYYKGATRTGCVACGFGATNKNDPHFSLLYNLYPKYYEMIMNFENNGIPYREALRKAMSVNGLSLPDEQKQLSLF